MVRPLWGVRAEPALAGCCAGLWRSLAGLRHGLAGRFRGFSHWWLTRSRCLWCRCRWRRLHPLRRRTARPTRRWTRRTGSTPTEQLAHRVADLRRLDAVSKLHRLDDPTKLRQRSSLDRQVGQELVEDLVGRLGTRVRREERQQLVALTSLTPTTLGSLLEPSILAHLRWATRSRPTVAHWRATRTTRSRATVAKRRAWTTRTAWPIAKRRAWTTRATRPIAERRARTRPIAKRRTRTRDSGHWRRQSFESCPIAATVWSPEALATALGAATAALTAAALATTTATTTRPATATAAARPDRHVTAPTVVVVHATTVHALASATALTVAVRAHLHDDCRPIIVHRRRRGWGDSKLLEICKLLQQRFLKTLCHPFSYCARAVPVPRARSR